MCLGVVASIVRCAASTDIFHIEDIFSGFSYALLLCDILLMCIVCLMRSNKSHRIRNEYVIDLSKVAADTL